MKYLIGLIFCFILIFVVACDSKLGLENLSNFNFENQKSPFVQNILPSQYELEKFRDLEILFSEPVFLGRKASKKFTIYKNKLRIKTKIFCSQISRESEELCESVLISQDSRNKEKDLKPGVYVLKIKSSVYNADGYPMLDAEGHKDDFEYLPI